MGISLSLYLPGNVPVLVIRPLGILLWVGQLTGMVFVAGMSIHSNRYLGLFMNLFVILAVLTLAAVLILRESPMAEGFFRKHSK